MTPPTNQPINIPINPTIHPTTHTPTNRWGCLHKSYIFKQNLIILIRSRFIQFLVNWHECTHWPTNLSTNPWSIYPPIVGGVSRNHKSSNRIEPSQLVEELLHFYWFGGPTWLGGFGGTPTHLHACTHMLNMDAFMVAAICNYLHVVFSNTHVYVCVCMHVHV